MRDFSRPKTPDWMEITIRVPLNLGQTILTYLRGVHQFVDIDWCVLRRTRVPHSHGGLAEVEFGPCPPITEDRYAVPVASPQDEPFPEEVPP